MLKVSIIGLVLLLVLIIVYQYYKISEGFDNIIAPATAPTAPTAPSTAPSTAPATAPTAPATAPATTPTAPAVAPIAPPAQLSATLVTPSVVPASQEAVVAKEKQEKSELLRDIQQIVRTELLGQQKMTTASSQPVLRAGSNGDILMSPAAAQGQEMSTSREKLCPKDMSQYIRKDSIPCWNCSLDY